MPPYEPHDASHLRFLVLLLSPAAGGGTRLSSTRQDSGTASTARAGGFCFLRHPERGTEMSTADTFPPHIPADRTSLTDDERIGNIVPLPPPEHLIRFFPIQGTAVEAQIAETRARVRQILQGRSDRLLVVMGPCSIHDPGAALEYALRLAAQRKRHADDLEV